MKKRRFKQIKSFLPLVSLLVVSTFAQQATVFHRLGSQDESVQDLFPGEHKARPVMADFTNNGHMGLFYGGQDLGNSAGAFYNDVRWGDLGDGTFANPVLNADYSDPDVIRVGQKYYMVCSEFQFMGMPVLESEDMVNWKIIGQIYTKINFPEYDQNQRYGGGSWAPSIRYHDSKYWVYFCTPNEGLFMSNASNPAGPWSPLVNIKNVSGWEDPCPLWDENGQAYIGRSQLGGGPIIIHKMSSDGTTLLDAGTTVYNGPTSEGTKLFKKDGLYYISIPEGGVGGGWQTVLRSNSIYGPYEKKVVLEMGSTPVNGPHQGALVDTPNGEWWFFHFQSLDPLGRVVHLQPAAWDNGWPVIGKDYNKNGIGEPVKICKKPNVGKTMPVLAPQSSDEFTSVDLGFQWQFNHNPVNTNWFLTQRSGWLTLKALKADRLRNSKNMLTQKTMGYIGEASTELDCSQLADGQRAGLLCIGNKYNAIGVFYESGERKIYIESEGSFTTIASVSQETVFLKVTMDANANKYHFYYSTNNQDFISCGDTFSEGSRDWKGARVGLYSYNEKTDAGDAFFNRFNYKFDGPGQFIIQ